MNELDLDRQIVNQFLITVTERAPEVAALKEEVEKSLAFCKRLSQIGNEIKAMLSTNEALLQTPPEELEGLQKHRRQALIAVACAYPGQAERAVLQATDASRLYLTCVADLANAEAAAARETMSQCVAVMADLRRPLLLEEGAEEEGAQGHLVTGKQRVALMAQLRIMVPRMLALSATISRGDAVEKAAKALLEEGEK